jgi:[protein-PII] uridylyltransferase
MNAGPEPARAALAQARARVRADLRAGVLGGDLSATFSDSVAKIVVSLAEDALAVAPEGVALVAIGALGRRELSPWSDLDLVLLAPASAGDEPLGELARRLVHPLWDAGLRPNLVVHDPKAWPQGATADLTVATSLLDARTIAGAPGVLEAVLADAWPRLFGDARAPFLERVRAELSERHARYGGTVYRLEPDLKHGPGGLRDLAAVGWSLRATYGTRDFGELVERGVIRPRLAAILGAARHELLRLRAALHVGAERAQDRLVFQYQEALPVLLGLLPEGPQPDAVLVSAIETAMQAYYRAARDLQRYGRRVDERCLPAAAGAATEPVRLDERFVIEDGRLRCREADAFTSTPVLSLEAIDLRREHGVELHGETFDAIAEATLRADAEALADEPEAHRRFLDLLVEADDPGDPTALELCHDLRLLERVVPSFAPVRGRMQHDPYHVYTVDQHTLEAIDMLKRIARGEHNKDYPLATALHQEIDDPRVLYLGALCHDLGKAEGGDQCESGAVIAREVATRLRLPPHEVDRCARLVLEHLTMPLLSQKRDLGDPLLISSFADRMGDRQTLKELYLLSLVDTAQVRPGNLTSWKLALLDELYLRASAQLRGRQARRVHVVAEGEPAGLPERYYAIFHAAMRRRHGALVERLLAEGSAALLDLDVGPGAVRLTLVARDRPGLLAHAAEVFDEAGLSVMAADVFTQPGQPPIAIDVFRIDMSEGDANLDAQRLSQLEAALHRVDTPGEPPGPRARPRRFGGPMVPTRVAFSTDPSGDRTVVDVETAEGPGVLRRITRAFAAEGLEILLARCATEGAKAADVFYVARLSDTQIAALDGRLRDYLAMR